ncbi:MAG: tetratricopeptide repeat protein [Nitrospirae bacterium]|nr:MAG: tetratricopeptide repeat protein [Nitrospirota bacterium]
MKQYQTPRKAILPILLVIVGLIPCEGVIASLTNDSYSPSNVSPIEGQDDGEKSVAPFVDAAFNRWFRTRGIRLAAVPSDHIVEWSRTLLNARDRGIGLVANNQTITRLAPSSGVGAHAVSARVDYNHGVALLEQGHVSQAIDEWRSALRKDPTLAEAAYALGRAYLILGETAKAVQALYEALKKRPGWAAAHAQLGVALYQARELDQAEAHLLEAVRLKPRLGEAYVNLGLVRFMKDDRPGAVAALQQAIHLAPDLPEAHFNLGVVLVSRAEWEQAILHLEHARKLAPDIGAISRLLGLAYMATGEWTRSRAMWREALETDPDSALLHGHLAMAWFQTGNWREAEASLRAAVSRMPDDAHLQFRLGVVLQAQGKMKEAIAAFRRASELNPTWVQPLLNWAQALTDQPARAMALYRQAIARDPDCAEAYYQLGLTYAVLGQEAHMAEAFHQAATRGLTAAQTDLGMAYFTGSGVARDIGKAMVWWQKAAAHGSLQARQHLSDQRRVVFQQRGSVQEIQETVRGFAELREAWRRELLASRAHVLRASDEESLGVGLLRAGQGQAALSILLQEALLLDERAAAALEEVYREGIPPHVRPFDPQILEYFQTTAWEGRRRSCDLLETIYRQGWGVPQNPQEARWWARQCAR